MASVQRSELVTQDMDVLADLVRQLYFDHTASFRCPDPAVRRYYGTTPAGYLRRVRLERAHLELLAADPASGLTVRTVASRWGWVSHSRFSVAYQQRFGMLPSRTLRS